MAALELTERVLGPTQLWDSVMHQVSPTAHTDLVSVILPTRNRSILLGRAIRSILTQSYSRLELIIVDDGSTDDTANTIESIQDPRVVMITGGGQGAAAARNLALSRATGSIIAFADDDNVMAPGWLMSVVSYLQRNPATAGVYGAVLRESEDSTSINVQFFTPFDRQVMRIHPVIDLGASAFRSGIEGLIFDAELQALIDWDMLIRVTSNHRLDAIPTIASLYTTSAPDRITKRSDRDEHRAIVAARAAKSEPTLPDSAS